jgi:competence protein CoiA
MCGERLIAKCGRIVTHHWAHKGKDCDPWREPETEWHRYWKSLVPASCVEVTIQKNGEKHRADIVTPKGTVVELQRSTLGVDKIEQREEFYGRMIWLFDVREARPAARYHPEWYSGQIPTNETAIRLRLRKKEKGYHTFRWHHSRKSVAHTGAETYLDVGRGEVFRLMKMAKTTPCGGWGYLKPADVFVAWLQRTCA